MLLKTYKKSILIGLFLFNSFISYSFRLQNVSFNQRIDTEIGGYREFYIENDYLTKQRYKVKVLPGSKDDISKYVEAYPKVITIDPHSKGVVKVFVKAPQNIKQKEYDFKIQFQPINIPTLAKSKEGKMVGTSNIGIAPIIELKSYAGLINFQEALKLKNVEILKDSKRKGIVVTGELSNDSYASIDFSVEAYGRNNYLYGSSYVAELPGKIKDRKISLFYPMIKNIKDLKKIVFYRTPSDTREVIKEIDLIK